MWGGGGREGREEERRRSEEKKRGREERVKGGERGKEHSVPMSISRFFEILKTVVDYRKRQSGKSVMTSVSQSLHEAVYCCMQQCAVYCVSTRLVALK